MKRAVVVYWSRTGNTEKVAKTVDGALREKGFSVDCLYVADADPANVRNYDCVMVGSPTEGLRAKKPIMEFLDDIPKDEFSGKPAAAFDTQMQNRLSGNAAKGIQKKLENLDFKIITEPLVTYVEGKIAEIHLKDGEIEKTGNWAQELAKALQKWFLRS